MCLAFSLDLMRLYKRHDVAAMPFHKIPDLSSLGPMRLIAACADETSDLRKNLTCELYRELWLERKGKNLYLLLSFLIEKLLVP